ncbi:hypothetical protein HPB48_003519 [Haemaphysalis longicornis]|uniref:alkaline phosphatase n=1 Tax=Haemaphysalis longicornis TaxID=44386 RepID=A0A9J6G9N4_HAELO|nr:hypothetical protein HPB48_003519 [Haemaphysalis longicornis]
MAHHSSQGGAALEEALEFDQAVAETQQRLNPKDSLIVVTADHSHSFAMGGNPDRGANILARPDYAQQSAFPLIKATHGGEDVAVYATGPWAHLYSGVHDQTYIPYVMAYAACVGRFAGSKCGAHPS